jgi:hypothetical protein
VLDETKIPLLSLGVNPRLESNNLKKDFEIEITFIPMLGGS